MATPSTPQSQTLQAAVSTPSPGSWQHPRFDEIARRQKANTFNGGNLQRIAWNGGALMMLFLASSYPWFQQIMRHDVVRPFATPALLLLYLLGLYNIAIASLPLVKNKDELADIPLTPTQRSLLGLDPRATPPPTPGTQYITPPRKPIATKGGGKDTRSCAQVELWITLSAWAGLWGEGRQRPGSTEHPKSDVREGGNSGAEQ